MQSVEEQVEDGRQRQHRKRRDPSIRGVHGIALGVDVRVQSRARRTRRAGRARHVHVYVHRVVAARTRTRRRSTAGSSRAVRARTSRCARGTVRAVCSRRARCARRAGASVVAGWAGRTARRGAVVGSDAHPRRACGIRLVVYPVPELTIVIGAPAPDGVVVHNSACMCFPSRYALRGATRRKRYCRRKVIRRIDSVACAE